ncbi:MAG: hypothetical protein V1820_01825 [archaeon]
MGMSAELFVSTDCQFCRKVVEEMRVILGEKFSRAVVVKDVDAESAAQTELLRMNFLSTPVLKLEGRTWAVGQLNGDAIRQVCTNLSTKF